MEKKIYLLLNNWEQITRLIIWNAYMSSIVERATEFYGESIVSFHWTFLSSQMHWGISAIWQDLNESKNEIFMARAEIFTHRWRTMISSTTGWGWNKMRYFSWAMQLKHVEIGNWWGHFNILFIYFFIFLPWNLLLDYSRWAIIPSVFPNFRGTLPAPGWLYDEGHRTLKFHHGMQGPEINQVATS